MSLTAASPFAVASPEESAGDLLRVSLNEATGRRQNFLQWSLRVPEPKSGTLDFAKFPFQLELYDQRSAEDTEAVIKKATQLGISTYLLRWVLYICDVRGLTALYLFPKARQMYDFSDSRIKAAILGSDYLRTRITAGDVQNKGLKKIGPGYLFCRGAESKSELQSIDADALAMDEYDEIRPENIPDAERRLGASDYKLLRRVGVPDLPGRGLDKLYNDTDKRRWYVQCEACGEKQALEYDANVDEDNKRLVCRRCGKARVDLSKGEWVAEYPERRVRGYHLSRLIVPNQDLSDIIEAHNKTNPTEVKTHFNKDLGLAYAPEEGRLSIEAITRAMRSDLPLDGRGTPKGQGEIRTMGVDVASTRALNVRISAVDEEGRRRCLYLALVEDFSELGRLMGQFDITFCLIDHLPEGRMARAFAEKFPGRAWLINYASSQEEILVLKPEKRQASVKRLEAIDATLDGIRTQWNLLPGELPKNYVRDLQDVVRLVEYDEFGKPKVTYQELGPTDWLQAEIYDLVAMDVYAAMLDIELGNEGTTTKLDDDYNFERSNLEIEGDEEYGPGEFDDGGIEPTDLGSGDF